MSAIILAGGKGTRMNSQVAKPLVKLATVPMIRHVIRTLKSVKALKQIIVVSDPDNIDTYESLPGVDKVVIQKESLGTFHAMSTAVPFIEHSKVIVSPGDKPLLDPKMIRGMLEMTENSILGYKSMMVKPVLVEEDGFLKYIQEDKIKDDTFYIKNRWRTGGLYCFNTDELKKIKCDEHITRNNKKHEYYLTDVFEHLTSKTRIVLTDKIFVKNINTQHELRYVEQYTKFLVDCNTKSHGRLNLMGRHIDHQGGYNNLTIIPQYVSCEMKRYEHTWPFLEIINGKKYHVYDLRTLDSLPNDWTKYVLAPFLYRKDSEKLLLHDSFSITIDGNIPQSVGLSSSSALIIAATTALYKLTGTNLTPIELTERCGEIERLVGTNGGCGDHAAIIMGESNKIIKAQLVPDISIEGPVDIPDYLKIAVFDSGVKAEKSEECKDRYNTKISEYKEGLKILGCEYIGQVNREDLSKIQDSDVKKTITYGINEYDRSELFIEACKRNDLALIRYMVNRSMKDEQELYRCSCKEVDDLVRFANDIPGVLGSQMCGAGFGGCVAVFANSDADLTEIKKKYPLITVISSEKNEQLIYCKH